MHFWSQARKIKKKSLWKNFLYFLNKKFFLYFGKWNFLALRLKNSLYFLKKNFSGISGNGTFLKKLPIFQKGTFRVRKAKKKLGKNFLYFGKWNFLVPSLKNSYFFYKTFLIFQEETCNTWKAKSFSWNDCWSSLILKKYLMLWDDFWSCRKTKNKL